MPPKDTYLKNGGVPDKPAIKKLAIQFFDAKGQPKDSPRGK